MELEERKMGNLTLWVPKGFSEGRSLTPVEKIRRDKHDTNLQEKAETRQKECWAYGCQTRASTWVREIQFDFKTDKASINLASVDTSSYDGPVPGFCHVHAGKAVEELVQKVYNDLPPMQWGMKPTRWFVIFTDGTKTGGSCLMIDPKQLQPTIIETLVSDR